MNIGCIITHTYLSKGLFTRQIFYPFVARHCDCRRRPTPETTSRWLSAEVEPVPMFLRSDTVIYEAATQSPVDELF